MSWNTKRDGYYSRPAVANLGHPVDKLEPHAGHTHAVVIPGTSFKMFLGESYIKPQTRAGKDYPSKCEIVLKQLARTTVKGIGKRRTKAQPVLLTIAEFHALNSTAKAVA